MQLRAVSTAEWRQVFEQLGDMLESHGSGLGPGVAKLIGRAPSYQCYHYTELTHGASTLEARDFLAHQAGAARRNSLMSSLPQGPPGPGLCCQGRGPDGAV
eukprot:303166-Pyramimonas_sp.AAC.1